MSSAVCLIVKNEVENIAEWVAHNALLGFDEIIVYDNISDDGTTELLAELAGRYPLRVLPWEDSNARHSSCKQMAAYEHCFRHDRTRFDWLCFLDADEFLIPPPGSRIGDLLDTHRDASGLALNWRIFGSNGHERTQGRLVMEAFDRRAALANNTNRHVKMLFRPDRAIRLVNMHYVEVEGGVVGMDGRPVEWSEPGITTPDAIVSGDWKLHHYIIRSRTHWMRRLARRQTDGMTRDWSEFVEYDRNEVLDWSAFPQAEQVFQQLTAQGLDYSPVPQIGMPSRDQAAPPAAAVVTARPGVFLVLDGVQDGRVHGWGHDMADPGPLFITPCVDGQELAPVPCDGSRPDVLATGIGREAVGFSFGLPERLLDDCQHELGFLDPDGRPLDFIHLGQRTGRHAFRCAFRPAVFSAVDEMQSSLLRGWVACRRRPGEALQTGCDVLVTANGIEIATVRAGRARPDVGAALQCGPECGFALPLPPAYRTATVQEFRFFLMPERIELSGSPLVTSFAQHDHAMKLTGLLEEIETLGGQIDRLRDAVRSILPTGELTLDDYDVWQRQNQIALRRRVLAGRDARHGAAAPLVSVVCPVYRPVLRDFEEAVASVVAQTHDNWELILVDDGSGQAALDEVIDRLVAGDRRIRRVGDGQNRGISGATNLALRAARGEWIAFFDHDDLLVDVAFELMLDAAQASRARLVYSDEDKVDEFGFFSEPAFKPDWNHRYLLSVNYVNHLTLVRTDLVREIGCLRSARDGAQDHDFLLRLVERLQPHEVHHVPEVLYHWRKAAQSTSLSGAVKAYAVKAGVDSVSDHLRRLGRPAEVTSIDGRTSYRVRWQRDRDPTVTIIIPFKDRIEMTMRCLDHVLRHTPMRTFDVILIDNNSEKPETLRRLEEAQRDPRVSVLRIEEPFNYSRLNNLAAARSDAEFFVFMNNDLFVQDEHWLDQLLGECQADPGVGAVGGKFLFENRTIQHAGVVLGIGGVAGHILVGEPEHAAGYGSRAVLAHEVSAVTAACVLVRGSVFRRIGGFDEVNLAVAFNDIDLCLRIREAGYRIVMVPDFMAEHHESISRGAEDKPEKVARFNRESDYMKQRWGGTLTTDPYYSPHFALDRTPFTVLVSPS